jgi:hypothetical protein
VGDLRDRLSNQHHRRLRCLRRHSAAKDRGIPSARDLKNQRLIRARRCKVKLDPFSQLGRIDPDNIVGASVIGGGSSEYFGTNLLLMNLGPAILERLPSDI